MPSGRRSLIWEHRGLLPNLPATLYEDTFVLCPGGAYDRSPCGTGTSAKLACLAADGKLAPGELWIQESIIGSRFEGAYQIEHNQVRPSITGSAYITLEGTLLLDEADPLRHGIRGAYEL